MLTGPDVSHHQGPVDWPRVAGAGHRFAFCKATEGTGFVDSRFRSNWPAMRSAGLVRGAYHFLRTETDPRAQARHFLSVVGDLTGSLAALDVERSASGSNPTADQARAFKHEFEARTGGHPLVIYTGRWYWQGVLGNPHGADLGPLWHSAYSTSPGALYGGWDRYAFWQHTSSGSCPGVGGPCDLNRYFGDAGDLAALTGQEDDMLTPDDLLAALNDTRVAARFRELVQAELDEGTVFGTRSWSESMRTLVEVARATLNKVNAATDDDDVDEAALAAELLPGLLEVLGADRFADAIAAHFGADQARIFLDEFALALAQRSTGGPT